VISLPFYANYFDIPITGSRIFLLGRGTTFYVVYFLRRVRLSRTRRRGW